jgi:hypothetical protein
LHYGTSDWLPSCEYPKAEEHFEQADRPRKHGGVRRTEDFPHNQTMTRNPIEDLAVKAVENPNGPDQDLSRDVKAF